MFARKISGSLVVMIMLQWSAISYAQDNGLSPPEDNFETLWRGFDQHYALFGVKHIDWDAIYRVYRPRVTAETTDAELLALMGEMIRHLNDNHVAIRNQATGDTVRSGPLGEGIIESGNFSIELIGAEYAESGLAARADGLFHFGWLEDRIGYFHFNGFSRARDSERVIDEIIENFEGARAIVIDVRHNGGGSDRIGQMIANRFASERRLYMTVAVRVPGEDHNDFETPVEWYVEAAGPAQFTGPIVLLTNRRSVSAAENFALAVRALPQATIVGNITSGVMADSWNSTLPNGWRYRVPNNLFRDPNGANWEGIGIPADLRVRNSTADIDGGRDKVLEFAISIIKAGGVRPWNRELQEPTKNR